MGFRDALTNGFHNLTGARDVYRDVCEKLGALRVPNVGMGFPILATCVHRRTDARGHPAMVH